MLPSSRVGQDCHGLASVRAYTAAKNFAAAHQVARCFAAPRFAAQCLKVPVEAVVVAAERVPMRPVRVWREVAAEQVGYHLSHEPQSTKVQQVD